jgi:hypothetical protein
MSDGTLTITISPDGSDVKFDAEGFTGGKCEDLAKKAMNALGEVRDKKRKPEFYQEGSGGVHVGQ